MSGSNMTDVIFSALEFDYKNQMEVADELHITAVAVDPSVRRRGHGKRLLSALLQQARQQGAIHATLEVGSNNLAAIALYANGGFQSAGTRFKYYSDGSDALIQWCRINESK